MSDTVFVGGCKGHVYLGSAFRHAVSHNTVTALLLILGRLHASKFYIRRDVLFGETLYT
jgi:hypothetical protein